MMSKKILFVGFVALCFIVSLQVNANAEPIMTLEDVTIGYDYPTASMKFGSKSANYFADYWINYGSEKLEAFCIEDADVVKKSLNYDVLSFDYADLLGYDADRLSQAAWIANEFDNNIYKNVAAVQVAIWELTVETDDEISLGSGYVQSTSSQSFNDTVNGILAAAASENRVGNYGWAIAHNPTLDSGSTLNSQDYLIKNPVPEPATILLLGIGLVGLGTYRRKFRKA